MSAITALAAGKHYISTSLLHAAAGSNGGAGAHAVRRSDTAAMLTRREPEVHCPDYRRLSHPRTAELHSVSHKPVERHRTNRRTAAAKRPNHFTLLPCDRPY
jgi:hypothetical protein